MSRPSIRRPEGQSSPAPRRVAAAVGVDVGGTTIKAGLVDTESGHILRIASVPTGTGGGAAYTLGQLLTVVRQITASDCGISHLPAIGVAVPELVTCEGRISSGASLAWTTSGVERRLKKLGAARVYSDVQTAAFAEGRFGAGRREATFLYVSIGTGISCSLVIGGRPFLGAHGFALAFASGRSGDPDSDLGATLEERAGGAGLLKRARHMGLRVEDGTALGRLALRRGPAQRLIDSAAEELAMHVAILTNALDPGALIIGGGLGTAPGRYFETFARSLPRYRYAPLGKRLRVVRAKLGPYSGIVGAACWAAAE